MTVVTQTRSGQVDLLYINYILLFFMFIAYFLLLLRVILFHSFEGRMGIDHVRRNTWCKIGCDKHPPIAIVVTRVSVLTIIRRVMIGTWKVLTKRRRHGKVAKPFRTPVKRPHSYNRHPQSSEFAFQIIKVINNQ